MKPFKAGQRVHITRKAAHEYLARHVITSTGHNQKYERITPSEFAELHYLISRALGKKCKPGKVRQSYNIGGSIDDNFVSVSFGDFYLTLDTPDVEKVSRLDVVKRLVSRLRDRKGQKRLRETFDLHQAGQEAFEAAKQPFSLFADNDDDCGDWEFLKKPKKKTKAKKSKVKKAKK